MNQDIQVSLREEIKSACDYRPFEKCDYSSRIANEICCKKLEYVISQLDGMKQTIDEYHSEVWWDWHTLRYIVIIVDLSIWLQKFVPIDIVQVSVE